MAASRGAEPPTTTALRVASWNVDGLDEEWDTLVRAQAAADELLAETPDVICLQELTDVNAPVFVNKLRTNGYTTYLQEPLSGYYTAISIRTCDALRHVSHKTIKFPATRMGRALQKVTVTTPGGGSVLICTSHFESLAPSKSLRLQQLQFVLQEMTSAGMPAIFVGDTNLRDAEVKSVGGLPPGVMDCWEACGKKSDREYTWDLLINKNKEMPGGKTPRLRFDRMFCWDCQPSRFKLIGTDIVPACDRHASDHFGLFSTIHVNNRAEQ
eukprot:jgi/Chlat1/5589/Chrsp369S00856